MNAPARSIQAARPDEGLHDRFGAYLEALRADHKPTIEDMIETADRIEAQKSQSQRALVKDAVNADFYVGEARDCLHLRCLIDFLSRVAESKDEIAAVLRRQHNRGRQ